jgi:hypothetical protein
MVIRRNYDSMAVCLSLERWMALPPLSEPFVYPIGRDYAPRRSLSPDRAPAEALQIAPLDELLSSGLKRQISILATHATFTHADVRNNQFFLWSPFANLSIPCALQAVPGRPTLHREETVPYFTVPEKIWFAFRGYAEFLRDIASVSLDFRDIALLSLDFEVTASPTALAVLRDAFAKHKFNTLPLHLCHRWRYRPVESTVIFTEGGTSRYGYRELGETKVTNVWKDFTVVTRQDDPASLHLAVATDCHFAARNTAIKAKFPDAVDINRRVASFSTKAFDLWRDGKLDYLILNGDSIDFFFADNGNRNQNAFDHYVTADLVHEKSNWNGFASTTGLSTPPLNPTVVDRIFRRHQGRLFHIPLVLNVGDQDRFVNGYPIPYVLVDPDPTPNLHLNMFGLSGAKSRAANLEFNYESELTSGHPNYVSGGTLSGQLFSHPGCLRWMHETARIDTSARRLAIKAAGRTFQLHFLDSGALTSIVGLGESPLCDGITQPIAQVSEGAASDFVIIFTHAPPVCLKPSSSALNSAGTVLNPSDPGTERTDYGSFGAGRSNVIAALAMRFEGGRPSLVVSGHVRFQSAYSLNKLGGVLRYLTGTELLSKLQSLSSDSANAFWNEHSCVFLTTAPVGPPSIRAAQRSGFLVLRLDNTGVSKLDWHTVEG